MNGKDLETLERVIQNDYAEGLGASNTVTHRGLFGNPELRSEGYVDIFPRIEGKNLVEWLDDHASARHALSLCDVGFGKGNFLLDAMDRYGSAFTYIGYGNIQASLKETYASKGIVCPPTMSELLQSGAHIIEGNLLNIHTQAPEHSVDLMLISHVLQYMRFSRAVIFERAIRSLRPGGHILIADARKLFQFPEDGDFFETQSCLNLLGYDIALSTHSFVRPGSEEPYTSYTTHIFPMHGNIVATK